MMKKLRVRIESQWYLVEVGDLGNDDVEVIIDDQKFSVNLKKDVTSELTSSVSELPPNHIGTSSDTKSNSNKSFKTPMPGSVIDILVKVGDKIVEGQEICILESMKMQQTLKSDFEGIITEILVSSGDQVLDGEELIKYS
tara:strand:- start:273 stop:692 length:420 start_codon:yes stop_codon:yes gene_type:complete